MKSIWIVLLTLSTFLVVAQSNDWKVIKSPEKNSIYLKYQSSQGYLFGYFDSPQELFFSKDGGNSWKHLPTQGDNYFLNKLEFREDFLHQVYIFLPHTSSISRIENDSVKVFYTTQNSQILDFKVLSNGKLCIVAGAWIKIIDTDGKEEASVPLSTTTAYILPAKDSSSSNFLLIQTDRDSLFEFDNHLIINAKGNPVSRKVSSAFLRNKNRIFNLGEYSDDKGNAWIKMTDIPSYAPFVVGVDGRLYSLHETTLFISNDNGNSFIVKPLPFYATAILSNNSGALIVSGRSNNDCEEDNLYKSTDVGDNWKIVPTFMIDEIFSLSPGKEENLFNVGTCSVYFKESENIDWKSLTIPDVNVEHFSAPKVLQNGTIMTYRNDLRALLTSDNKGKTWSGKEILNFIGITKPYFLEKKNVVFSLDEFEVHFSKDFGKSWNTHFSNFGFSQSRNCVTSTLKFYYIDFNFENFVIEDMVTSKVQKLSLDFIKNRQLFDFQSSFDGDTLYVLTLKLDTSGVNHFPELLVSTDGGANFTSKLLYNKIQNDGFGFEKLYVDHLGNLYLHNYKNNLWTSSDKGTTWKDISPSNIKTPLGIHDVKVSYDNYIYLSTSGTGVLKNQKQLGTPTADLEVLSLSIFPNPTEGVFTIQKRDWPSSTKVKIYDVLGNIVSTMMITNQNTIDISSLASGLYFVHIQDRNTIYSAKVVKQ